MNGLEEVRFADDAVSLTGWLQQPAGQPRGAVLIMPTIVNRNAAMDRRAQMLADAGFMTMIGDFYGCEVNDVEHGRALAGELRRNVSHYRNRLLANLHALRERSGDLPLAVIGFCMGGQAALELARSGARVCAVVSFHGLLNTDQSTEHPIDAKILVCHGDADPMVPRSQVSDFQREMDTIDADWQLMIFSGVKHGFTDPGSNARNNPALAYDAHADRQSWSAMTLLFDELMP